MSQQFRRTALAAYSVATILGLTACSSAAHSPAASAGSAAPATASAAASAAGTTAAASAGTAGLPDGTKLNSMLLPAGAIPSRLKLDPSGTRSTGNGFNPPMPASSAPASKPCDALSSTGWINTAGISSASFAQNDYADSSQNMFAQELDAFRGTDAQTVMAHLKQVLTGCSTFKADQNGQSYDAKVSLESLPGVGDEAVKAVMTSPSWSGGTTLVAARVGNLVVTTLYNDQSTTGTAGVALTTALAKNVKATG